MKKYILMFVLTALMVEANAQRPVFYYYKNDKIQLRNSTDDLVLKIDHKSDPEKVRNLATKLRIQQDFKVVFPASLDGIDCEYIVLKKNAASLVDMEAATRAYLNEPVVLSASSGYLADDDVLQALTDEIVIKSTTELTQEQMRQISEEYHIQRIKKDELVPYIYHLFVSKEYVRTAADIAAALYETGRFDFSEPNFFRMMQPHCTTSDTYFGSQWGIKNTGQYSGTPGLDVNACNAWGYTKGANIKVAVIDEGVDLYHPDLNVSVSDGYDATGGGSGGAPQSIASHGTSCAGIIGAKENSIGVVGVAPQCSIVPVRIATKTTNNQWITDNTKISNGINWAWQHADILSNSWGGGSSSSLIDNAIYSAHSSGRGGFGCPVIFSTGNGNSSSISYPSTVAEVVPVGAMSMCGQRKHPSSCDGENWWGSNYGFGLSVVAPGVKIYTTDIQGSGGSSGTDYEAAFNGTSSACPFVAGTAALLLAVNPCLRYYEVKDLIEMTADKLPSYSYGTAPMTTHHGSTWNTETGFGKLNAGNALQLAHDIYKQNRVVTGTYTYSSAHKIYAGENVTSLRPVGDYVVQSGAKIKFYAPESISLKPGFVANPGSVFLAEIATRCIASDFHYKPAGGSDAEYVAAEKGNLGTLASAISVYPNPATSYLQVEGATNVPYTIIDMAGRVVLKGTLNSTVIDIRSLIAGNYIIAINNGTDAKQFAKFTKE